MKTALEQITWEWGVRCFGLDHMRNQPLRSLRLVEEAVELAQALNVPRHTLFQLIDAVYQRPTGQVIQELGGVAVTTSVLCSSLGLDLEGVFRREVLRVLAKSPDEFAKRNQDKLDLGLKA